MSAGGEAVVDPVVIVELQQGLGNQLFQYAMGLSLARRLGAGASLLLDCRSYQRAFQRPLLLPSLLHPLGGRLANAAELAPLLARPDLRRVLEPDMGYQEISLERASCLHVSGWWQSYRYVGPVDDLLRASLRNLASFQPPGRSVGIHVRGGDYRLGDFYQVADAGYYRRALEMIEDIAPGCEAFVFTDDPGYAREVLPAERPMTWLATRDPIADLVNLSRCSHQIIPNSTFGWWAGFFNPNPAKRVLMPADWFNPAYARTSDFHRTIDLGAPYTVKVPER